VIGFDEVIAQRLLWWFPLLNADTYLWLADLLLFYESKVMLERCVQLRGHCYRVMVEIHVQLRGHCCRPKNNKLLYT
jgi:hypothetical protein